jgi:uncharacterized protein (DUF1501 family)
MKKITRRNFLKKSGIATIAGLSGVQVGFGNSLSKGLGSSNRDLLVYVFLDGGMDGLNMVPPRSGSDYTQYSSVLRPSLHISNTQSLALNGSSSFGMHPSAPEFANLFNQNKMAIIHATGLLEANRSHFVSTALLEQGIQNQGQANGTGWLTRYFNSSLSTDENALIPLLVPSYNNRDAVLGDPSALIMGNPNEFALSGGFWGWNDQVNTFLSEINQNANTPEKLAALQTLNASSIIQSIDWENYIPEGGANYPVGYFGDQLQNIAQLYKANVDLEVAYIPYGGWDTHVGQGTGTTGTFAELAQGLSQGLNALYQDLHASYPGQFTIILQSEFGRRAYENGDNSTDHGYGNPMFVISDQVNGGFHGTFPGLSPNQLFEQQDLDVTVDYRDVVSEILMKRMRNRFLGYIFPGYNDYTPLGIINGEDLIPIYDYDYDPLFSSSFE